MLKPVVWRLILSSCTCQCLVLPLHQVYPYFSHAASFWPMNESLHESLVRLLLPPPLPPPTSTGSWRQLKIVTGGDETSVESAQNVIGNQQNFAQRHGYSHEVHVGNYARPWIAYWHKIDVLLRELRAPNPPEVLVWFDLDLVVTNPTLNMLEAVLAAHPSEKMILTEDALTGSDIPGIEGAKRFVNTGVILVRASPEAERVLEKLQEYGREHRNAAYLPQDTNTLHEQDAFNSLLGGPRKHVWRRHVAVIPQRSRDLNLNTFARNLYDTHFQDPIRAEWRAGDFVAHCTGLRKQLREWCITDTIEAAELAAATADMCRNKTQHEAAESALASGHKVLHADQSVDDMLKTGSTFLQAQTTAWFNPHAIWKLVAPR